jgi:hypothetical protein
MITEATLNQWAETQWRWLFEFNFRLEVNKHKGIRKHNDEEPWVYLFLTHSSGHYTQMRLERFGEWPEARLHNILGEMIKITQHLRYEYHKKGGLTNWSDSVNYHNEKLEDDTINGLPQP